MSIKLTDIIPIGNLYDYKLHLACWNKHDQPLDVFVRSKDEWNDWNSWRSHKDDFSRKYIFSLMDFYPEAEMWLFGGIYKVLSRGTKNYSRSYKVRLLENSKEFIGRLKVHLKRPARAKAFRLEKYYKSIEVVEIFKECYSGEKFCGLENINHAFRFVESIYKNNKLDWKTALENHKGVYLITDKSNGKRYVGSAYGDSGIWKRWACYIGTGHGWNDELINIIKGKGIEYARSNFSFTLLECMSMKADDKKIIERERFWKEALMTRGNYGYNKN